ncbi:tetratricopeptide repeat protein [Candidatus Synechococcus calcipolaris G9]|uniref:Tetratricopeptide repeat protein n=1 Tax=Candidatus Synechococcus calcipolaris G9 TaxID=1497997 RepID=A0ABT6ETV9_9SYNE|nr:tetratricopeptide repeat protein [Candidatus Synechococcus calcipolaris]MDG2989354.1 tetratricopeptide repeat protein [Candidatus Synechococcus calcipolaris G9]
MDQSRIDSLLEALRDGDPQIRERATQELWHHWFCQKGTMGLQALKRSQELLSIGDVDLAEDLLCRLIEQFPDFAEALNRRAVLYYTQGKLEQAIADCERVLELVPYHFGALHGLGLCYQAQGDYGQAIQLFRRALDIQPHALINQRLILECTAQL